MSLEGRENFLRSVDPQLIADLYLYPAESGGKTTPVLPGWGCPCYVSKTEPVAGWDGWPILTEPLGPGERRRVGFVFLSGEEAAQVFRRAGSFYLREHGFVGEASVVS